VTKVEEFGKKMAERKDHIQLQLKKTAQMIDDNQNTQAFTDKISLEARTQVKKLAEGAERLIDATFNTDTFKEKLEKFRAGVKQCFDEHNKFRLTTLCGACSTRAASFFNTGKVKISQESCVKVVAACVHSWRFMFNTIQTIKALVMVPKIEKFQT